jgi:hypothetical protein
MRAIPTLWTTKSFSRRWSPLRAEVKKYSSFTDAVEAECSKYPDKSFTHLGCRFTKQERPTYNLDVCEDDAYEDMVKEMEVLKERMKEREAFLKSLKEPVVSADTGAMIYPPLKTSKSIVSVSLAL